MTVTGPTPILIDVDGVRHYSWRGEGIRDSCAACANIPNTRRPIR